MLWKKVDTVALLVTLSKIKILELTIFNQTRDKVAASLAGPLNNDVDSATEHTYSNSLSVNFTFKLNSRHF